MRILFILLLTFTITVEARMYQWVEPGSETTQLSGKPPSWYRSAAGGPRVFVFDKGRLVDDTAIEVDDDVRHSMRQQAFMEAEEDRQIAKEKIAKAQELKNKYKKVEPEKTVPVIEDTDDSVMDEDFFSEETIEADQDDDSIINEEKMDNLRQIIADWEKAQTESAKQAIE
jgi:hypothetical protein